MSEDKKALAVILFAKYTATDQIVESTKQAYEKALVERSKVVEEISTQLGKGPFNYQGHNVKVCVRGETHFFRGKSKEEVFKVD